MVNTEPVLEVQEVQPPEQNPVPVHTEMVNTQTASVQIETVSEVNAVEEEIQSILPYTSDMPVEEICRLMTIEEAGSLIVDVGTCKGWTLEQVAERRAASLKWYINGYSGDNNILRAGAKLLLERNQGQMAS